MIRTGDQSLSLPDSFWLCHQLSTGLKLCSLCFSFFIHPIKIPASSANTAARGALICASNTWEPSSRSGFVGAAPGALQPSHTRFSRHGQHLGTNWDGQYCHVCKHQWHCTAHLGCLETPWRWEQHCHNTSMQVRWPIKWHCDTRQRRGLCLYTCPPCQAHCQYSLI